METKTATTGLNGVASFFVEKGRTYHFRADGPGFLGLTASGNRIGVEHDGPAVRRPAWGAGNPPAEAGQLRRVVAVAVRYPDLAIARAGGLKRDFTSIGGDLPPLNESRLSVSAWT